MGSHSRMEPRHRLAGFTLIEMMISVAIVGLLASIAIPNFMILQLRSKRSEVAPNVDAIRTAEIAYHAEWDSFTSVQMHPASPSGRSPTEFLNPLDFQLLGWQPDGDVRGSYGATASTASSSEEEDFQALGLIDLDGDGVNARFTANRTFKPAMITSNHIY